MKEIRERGRSSRPYILGAIILSVLCVVLANAYLAADAERDCWRDWFETGRRPLDGTCRPG